MSATVQRNKPAQAKRAEPERPVVREALPAGKVPGGFARDFVAIFGDELAEFLARETEA